MKIYIFFRKVLLVLLIVGLPFTLSSEPANLNAQALALGDVNGDSDITSVDAAMTLQIVNGLINPTPEQRSASDIDQNGEVTKADAEMILQCASEKSKIVTRESIGSEGGELEANNLTISISAGAFSEEETITIKEIGDYPIKYETLNTLGPFYQIENFPPLQGTITIRVSFDPSAVLPEDSVYIYTVENSFVTGGGGEMETEHPLLNTEVDRINGVATIQITHNQDDGGLERIHGVEKLIGQQDESESGKVTVGAVRADKSLLDLGDDFFKVKDLTGTASLLYLDEILQYLNTAKYLIEDITGTDGIGFNFNKHDIPLVVNITTNIKNPKDNGEAICPYWSPETSYINLKPNLEAPKISAGHELFHIIAYLYGAYKWLRDPGNYGYVWIHEASAVWFETMLSEDPNYFSAKASDTEEMQFIFHPLETEKARHGYGASSFLRYLTEKCGYGDALILTIFQTIQSPWVQGYYGTGALEEAVGGGTMLGGLFSDFAFKFITNTTGYSNWKEPEPLVTLPAVEAVEQPEVYNVSLAALSAWNCKIIPPPFSTVSTIYKLTISLEIKDQNTQQDIQAKVYTRDGDFSPWQSACESLSPDKSCSIPNFYKKGSKRSANVILVNKKAETPYNQVANCTVTIRLTEQDTSVGGIWDVNYFDLWCMGNPEKGTLEISEDGTYEMDLSKDQFEGQWILEEDSIVGDRVINFYRDGKGYFLAFVNETYDVMKNEGNIGSGNIVCFLAYKIQITKG